MRENLSDDDDDLELLTIKFKEFTKQELKNKNKLKKDKTTWYECNRVGHLKSECPQVKKKLQKKKKALKAIWDKSSELKVEEQTNEEKVTNYTLMTFNDEVFNSSETSLLHEELLKSFYDLYDKFKKIGNKYSLLK